MKKLIAVCVTVALGLTGMMAVNAADKDKKEKPKYEIKDVMKKAMKGGLCKKVAAGKASKEEQALLVELFVSLHAHKPPKGDSESWSKKTQALLDAAKKGDGAELKKAANCGACHKVHKPS